MSLFKYASPDVLAKLGKSNIPYPKVHVTQPSWCDQCGCGSVAGQIDVAEGNRIAKALGYAGTCGDSGRVWACLTCFGFYAGEPYTVEGCMKCMSGLRIIGKTNVRHFPEGKCIKSG